VPSQLSLFGEAVGANAPRVWSAASETDHTLARAVPQDVSFGTSTWTFPGWRGIVYAGDVSAATLRHEDGLRAYAAHPLLRTVGVDRSYYAPLRDDEAASYARALPDGFRCVVKLWSELVSPTLSEGGHAAPNPRFLDVAAARAVLEPLREHLRPRLGAVLLPFPPFSEAVLSAARFASALDVFLASLGCDLPLAVEVRSPHLLTPRYLDTLRAHRVAHTPVYWTAMPRLRDQFKTRSLVTARFTVLRLMLPPYTKYEQKKAEYAPFDRIVMPQPEMREDTVRWIERARDEGAEHTYVIVNNKAEGSAPLTIRAIAERLAALRSG
jgi:uncharacterized protein YecE (DUF72 family)